MFIYSGMMVLDVGKCRDEEILKAEDQIQIPELAEIDSVMVQKRVINSQLIYSFAGSRNRRAPEMDLILMTFNHLKMTYPDIGLYIYFQDFDSGESGAFNYMRNSP